MNRTSVRIGIVSAICAFALSLGAAYAGTPRGTLVESLVGSGDPIESYVAELDDEAGRFDIQDVVRMPLAARFRFADRNAGRLPTRCRWYRMTLARELERAGPWLLAADVDSATLFEPTETGYRAERFGSDAPVASRRVRNGLPNVDLLPGDYGKVVFVRLDGSSAPTLRLEKPETAEARERDFDLSGVFYGAIFGVLMVSAALFALITRVPAFGYYSAYTAVQTLNQLNDLPFASRTLWPGLAEPSWTYDIVYAALLPITFMLFLRSALATRTSPVLDRLMLAAGITNSVIGLSFLVVDRYRGTKFLMLLPVFYVAMNLAMSAIAFVRWRQGYVSAGIYLIGVAGVAAGFAAYAVDPAVDTVDIGFVWEAVAFLCAIAYRLVQITSDRERALAEAVVAKEAVAEAYALRVATAEGYAEAFERFVPHEFLEQLGREDVRDVRLGDHVELEMTVLFCDIRAFVSLSEQLTPQATFDFLNLYFGRVGPIVRANNGFIDKYVGDGVMALFPGSTDDAIRTAIALHGEVRRFNEMRARDGSEPIEVGVGLHRGRLMLATIGESRRFDTTVIADVVNVAARLEGLTNIYGARIIASHAVISAVADPQAYNLRWLGHLRVRGSALPTSSYEICDGDPAQLLLHKRSTSATFSAALAAYRRRDFASSASSFSELVRTEPQDSVARFFAERSGRRAEAATEWDGVDYHDMKR